MEGGPMRVRLREDGVIEQTASVIHVFSGEMKAKNWRADERKEAKNGRRK